MIQNNSVVCGDCGTSYIGLECPDCNCNCSLPDNKKNSSLLTKLKDFLFSKYSIYLTIVAILVILNKDKLNYEYAVDIPFLGKYFMKLKIEKELESQLGI